MRCRKGSKSIRVVEIERAKREILKFVQWLSFREEVNRGRGEANNSKVRVERVAGTVMKLSIV